MNTNQIQTAVYAFKVGAFGLLALIMGCTTTTRVDNTPSAQPRKYIPVDQTDNTGNMGIESQDIVSMTDKMVRDMLQNPVLSRREKPPIVILDDNHFMNRSSQRLDNKLIIDRLRIGLVNAAEGRMRFFALGHGVMLDEYGRLVFEGTLQAAPQEFLKPEFRLAGSVQNLPSAAAKAGDQSNYIQVVFEIINLQTGEQVWGGIYECKKASRESPVYR